MCRTSWSPNVPSWSPLSIGWPNNGPLVPDEKLAAAVDADTTAARTAASRVSRNCPEQLAAKAPDAVAAELADAVESAAALGHRHDDVTRTLHEIAAQLTVFGTEGRKGKLDAADVDCEHARSEHDRVGRRARAVHVLREVMTRHRDTTRLRYVEPYRAELQRLGKPVFGTSFEVEVDSDLCIVNRTLDGRTVPYESLSGGAKEQLGILARLAGAALVAKEDAVPILIDDALGFTDPERLVKMAAVFDTLGERGQVIVLTCHASQIRRRQGCAADRAVRLRLSVERRRGPGWVPLRLWCKAIRSESPSRSNGFG